MVLRQELIDGMEAARKNPVLGLLAVAEVGDQDSTVLKLPASALGTARVPGRSRTGQRVEHVGSTSVPGLAAKPVIDIQVSTADVAAEDLYSAPLERAGVQLRYRDNQHRFFRPFPGRSWDVHVHVCAAGSRWERRHLLVRGLPPRQC